jgi:hypothetical protein
VGVTTLERVQKVKKRQLQKECRAERRAEDRGEDREKRRPEDSALG